MNINETCQKCEQLDECFKIIEDNINLMLIPKQHKTKFCVYFNPLESEIKPLVWKHICENFLNYIKGEQNEI